jgi:RHS repeat-associated protein
MQTTYNQPDVSLTYANGGLDRYGRIINHSWMKNNNPFVHIIHSYDYNGNRIKRYDPVHATNSELYTYDNLGQIKTLNRGALNTAQNAVTTVNHSESWDFDKTGNWSQYVKNGNTENRTHNAANELQGIATHDANGNMVLMPGLKGKYDAWNRLVEVRDSNDNLIASYEYNGLNQRTKKTVGTTVTKSFFNEKWQEVESITNNQVTSYVWGLRYIDDLVLREKDNERLYSLADSNWNVIAICDVTGDVQERYTYDTFGKRNIFDTDFMAKTGSDYNWNRGFTGQVLDIETGMMLYRRRFYNAILGRFVQREPIGYKTGDYNLMRYVRNKITNHTDPLGLMAVCCRKLAAGAAGNDVSVETAVYISNYQHCQLRNICAAGEKSYPVQIDPDPNRKLPGCPEKNCAEATQSDIEKCLKDDAPQNDGTGSYNNNCQSNVRDRLSKCCMQTTWQPQVQAALPQGVCLEWEYVYYTGMYQPQYICKKWEYGDYSAPTLPYGPSNPPPFTPILPIIEDQNHGGWKCQPPVNYPQ